MDAEIVEKLLTDGCVAHTFEHLARKAKGFHSLRDGRRKTQVMSRAAPGSILSRQNVFYARFRLPAGCCSSDAGEHLRLN